MEFPALYRQHLKDAQTSGNQLDVIQLSGDLSAVVLYDLPDEILLRIFGYVTQADRNRLSLMCHRLYAICKDKKIAQHCTVDFLKLVRGRPQFLCGFIPVSCVKVNNDISKSHFSTNGLRANIEKLPRLSTVIIIPNRLRTYDIELVGVIKFFLQATKLVLEDDFIVHRGDPTEGFQDSVVEVLELFTKCQIQQISIDPSLMTQSWFSELVRTTLFYMPQLNELVLPALTLTEDWVEPLLILLERQPITLTLTDINRRCNHALKILNHPGNLRVKAENVIFDLRYFDESDIELIEVLNTALIACNRLELRNIGRGLNLDVFAQILPKAVSVLCGFIPLKDQQSSELHSSHDAKLSPLKNMKLLDLTYSSPRELHSEYSLKILVDLLQHCTQLEHLKMHELLLLKLFEMKSRLLERVKHIEILYLSWTNESPVLNVNLSHDLQHLRLPDLSVVLLTVDCKIIQSSSHAQCFQHFTNHVRRVDDLRLFNVDELSNESVEVLEKLGRRHQIQQVILDKTTDKLKNLNASSVYAPQFQWVNYLGACPQVLRLQHS